MGGYLSVALLLLFSVALFGYLFWLDSIWGFLGLHFVFHAFFVVLFGSLLLFFIVVYGYTTFRFFFPAPDYISFHRVKVYCQGFFISPIDFDRMMISLHQQNNRQTGYLTYDLQRYLKGLRVYWMPCPFRVDTTWMKYWIDRRRIYVSYHNALRSSELIRVILEGITQEKGITWSVAHEEHVKRSNLLGPA